MQLGAKQAVVAIFRVRQHTRDGEAARARYLGSVVRASGKLQLLGDPPGRILAHHAGRRGEKTTPTKEDRG